MSLSEIYSVGGTLGTCMGCMVFVESIAKKDPAAMNLMTFASFAFVAFYGLIFTMKFFTVPFKIPFKGYFRVVTLFFLVNVINNQALNYHVPVPLHIIFRSGSLLAQLVLMYVAYGKRYGMRKYLSVLAITLGIILCTLATSAASGKDTGMTLEDAAKHKVEWTIGITMLTAALFASALLGVWQQDMYNKYGKHPDEALFVTHFASLPFFLFMYSDIVAAANRFSLDRPFSFAGYSLPVPTLWLELLINSVLQYGCISFVYSLNASVEALTVTLVVTLRKFLSLLVSIFWFQNPFTLTHWIGTALVFAGTIAFSDVFFQDSTDKKKKKQ